jgi:hypothetical protein
MPLAGGLPDLHGMQEVWGSNPIAPPSPKPIIRNPEPRLGSLAGQPSTAHQTGRTSIQVRSAHRSGRAPSDGSRLRNASFTGPGARGCPGGLDCRYAIGRTTIVTCRGQGGRASNRAGYIRCGQWRYAESPSLT